MSYHTETIPTQGRPQVHPTWATSYEQAYRVSMAAGQDAGNRSMRKAGRDRWSNQDWDVATETAQLLLATLGYPVN